MDFWYLDEDNQPHAITSNIYEFLGRNGDLKKQVGRTEPIIGSFVSTMFLGYNLGGSRSRPLLFETAIFSRNREDISDVCERYGSWKEAVAGHKKWCDYLIDVVIGDQP